MSLGRVQRACVQGRDTDCFSHEKEAVRIFQKHWPSWLRTLGLWADTSKFLHLQNKELKPSPVKRSGQHLTLARSSPNAPSRPASQAGGARRCVTSAGTPEVGEARLPGARLQPPLTRHSPLIVALLPQRCSPTSSKHRLAKSHNHPGQCSAGCGVLRDVARVGWLGPGLGVRSGGQRVCPHSTAGGHTPSDVRTQASKATAHPHGLVRTLPTAQMSPNREQMDHGGPKMWMRALGCKSALELRVRGQRLHLGGRTGAHTMGPVLGDTESGLHFPHHCWHVRPLPPLSFR